MTPHSIDMMRSVSQTRSAAAVRIDIHENRSVDLQPRIRNSAYHERFVTVESVSA